MYSLLFDRTVRKGDRPVENINLTLKHNATHQNTTHQNTTKTHNNSTKHIKLRNTPHEAQYNTIQYNTAYQNETHNKKTQGRCYTPIIVLQNVIIKKKWYLFHLCHSPAVIVL